MFSYGANKYKISKTLKYLSFDHYGDINDQINLQDYKKQIDKHYPNLIKLKFKWDEKNNFKLLPLSLDNKPKIVKIIEKNQDLEEFYMCKRWSRININFEFE